MKNRSVVGTVLIGLVFVVLGLLLLSTLLDWLQFDALYRTLIPIILMAGGIGAFSASDPAQRRTGLGLALFTVGAIAFLLRFDLINQDHVSAILGVLLLVSGVILLTVIADRLSHKKPEGQSVKK